MSHLLYSLQKHGKNDVEVIEYGGEIWINKKNIEKKLDIANIADRTKYYSSWFKKNEMRNTRVWSCRIFIKNTLVVEIQRVL